MSYNFDNYPSYEYSISRFSRWIISVYLKKNISLEKDDIYTEADIDRWICAVEEMITPEFVKNNFYDVILEVDMIEQGLSGVFWSISHALTENHFTIEDLAYNQYKVLAYLLKREVLWAMEDITVWMDTEDPEGDSFTGEELNDRLEEMYF